jgi:hypothetical protein
MSPLERVRPPVCGPDANSGGLGWNRGGGGTPSGYRPGGSAGAGRDGGFGSAARSSSNSKSSAANDDRRRPGPFSLTLAERLILRTRLEPSPAPALRSDDAATT